MNHRRRSILQHAVVGLSTVSVAGCLTRSDPGDTDDDTGSNDGSDPDDTGNGSDDDSETGLTVESFETHGDCLSPESASIEWTDETIVITGCLVGRNGCANARLVPLNQPTTDGTLDVVVEAFVDADDDEACTEALINIGYELRLAVGSSGAPARIQVTHDDANGRSVITTADQP